MQYVLISQPCGRREHKIKCKKGKKTNKENILIQICRVTHKLHTEGNQQGLFVSHGEQIVYSIAHDEKYTLK